MRDVASGAAGAPAGQDRSVFDAIEKLVRSAAERIARTAPGAQDADFDLAYVESLVALLAATRLNGAPRPDRDAPVMEAMRATATSLETLDRRMQNLDVRLRHIEDTLGRRPAAVEPARPAEAAKPKTAAEEPKPEKPAERLKAAEPEKPKAEKPPEKPPEKPKAEKPPEKPEAADQAAKRVPEARPEPSEMPVAIEAPAAGTRPAASGKPQPAGIKVLRALVRPDDAAERPAAARPAAAAQAQAAPPRDALGARLQDAIDDISQYLAAKRSRAP